MVKHTKFLQKIIEKNSEYKAKIIEQQKHKKELIRTLKLIRKAKAFKLWQKINFYKRNSIGHFHNFFIKNRSYGDKSTLSSINLQNENNQLFQILANNKLPKVTVIGILYNKEKQIEYFLQSLSKQTYKGKIEIILVNDDSPDNSVSVVKKYLKHKQGGYKKLNVRIINNKNNMGNCLSRNIAINKSKGDIIVIIDADCVVNNDFIKLHVSAHLFNDCNVVIGPFNIETNGSNPFKKIKYYLNNPKQIFQDCNLQDSINHNSFLNCITRNFSIKRNFIKQPLFDPLFTYSKDPKSGFGWEDVEMGYRLYQRNAKIKFIDSAISLHVSHPSNTDEGQKPLKSLLNFRRLFEKHPELFLIARRWTLETYQKICNWIDDNHLPTNTDRVYLNHIFQNYLPNIFYVKHEKSINIISYRWHCPHQYEIYKLPYNFTLATGVGSSISDTWQYSHRPLRPNVNFLPLDKINPKNFDLAILHFDENCLSPKNCNGIISSDWGDNFKYFIKNISIPKVAICHGTPQFHGQFTSADNDSPNLMQPIEKERLKFVEFVNNVLIINNSYQAQREWAFKNSKVIWQGFDPTELPLTTYQKNILSVGKPMIERPHYRGYAIYRQVFNDFPPKYIPESLVVPEPSELYDRQSNLYAYSKYQNYIETICKYSIYFNPTIRSPMPRSRGEAMMCGLTIVTTNNHDVELFIKNGINGFYSNDPNELKDFLLYLIRNPKINKKIGLEGRKTAIDIFNHDRFLYQWNCLIHELIS